MKKLIKTLYFAATVIFSVNGVTADDVKMPLVGEWTNTTTSAEISQIKFFPNGLLTVVAKGNGWSAQYKVTSSSISRSDIYLVQGEIKIGDLAHFADRHQPSQNDRLKQNITEVSKLEFTAKLTNHQKVLTLQIDNKGVKKEFMLFRANDIKTGVIPAN